MVNINPIISYITLNDKDQLKERLSEYIKKVRSSYVVSIEAY